MVAIEHIGSESIDIFKRPDFIFNKESMDKNMILPGSNQVRVAVFSLPQLTQALFIQKNQTLQNRFLISVTLRWHRVSVACKNQSFKS